MSSQEFTINIQPAELSFSCQSDETILDAALRNHINLSHSCRNGLCDTCTATVINGSVIQGDKTIDQDNDCLTCLAKPTSDIKIETEYFEQLSAISQVTIPIKVNTIEFTADEIAVVKFRYPPTAKFNALAGQYVDLIKGPVRRSYSIAHFDPEKNELEFHIKKVKDGQFSNIVFNFMKPNDLLQLNGPFGTFFLRDDNVSNVFICGGTGFAPVQNMLEEIHKDEFKEATSVFWFNKFQNHFYSDYHERLATNNDLVTYENHLYSREADVVADVLHEFIERNKETYQKFNFYICGSERLVNTTKTVLTKHDVSKKTIFSDTYLPT